MESLTVEDDSDQDDREATDVLEEAIAHIIDIGPTNN